MQSSPQLTARGVPLVEIPNQYQIRCLEHTSKQMPAQSVLGCIPNVSEYFLLHSPALHFVLCVSGLKGSQQHHQPVVSLSFAVPEQGDFKGLERKCHSSPRKRWSILEVVAAVSSRKAASPYSTACPRLLRSLSGFVQTPWSCLLHACHPWRSVPAHHTGEHNGVFLTLVGANLPPTSYPQDWTNGAPAWPPYSASSYLTQDTNK